MTNPIWRAGYLGKRNMVALLLKHGADVNLSKGSYNPKFLHFK